MANSKRIKANEKIADVVVGGYKAIETGVVSGYKAIETSVVKGYTKIEGVASIQLVIAVLRQRLFSVYGVRKRWIGVFGQWIRTIGKLDGM